MTRHGLGQHRLYHLWHSMVQRTTNPNAGNYHKYGARGITVCNAWLDVTTFIQWAEANGWVEGLSLDRIDNDGPYSPENCRWVTLQEQGRNKRNNRFITYDGETKTLIEWTEDKRCAVGYSTLSRRLFQNWDPVLALITPPLPKGAKRP